MLITGKESFLFICDKAKWDLSGETAMQTSSSAYSGMGIKLVSDESIAFKAKYFPIG